MELKGYYIKEMSLDDFNPLYKKFRPLMFKGNHSYQVDSILSNQEIENKKILKSSMGTPYKLFLGVFDKEDNFVGWSWGYQESETTYYMCNSAIFPEHRRKGLYQALINKSLEVLSQKGFQIIYSRHCVTNNSVIIPKLKSGFIISQMELDDQFGVLIHLRFYTNNMRKKVMDYRCGQGKLDDEIHEIFKIN